MSSRRTVRYTPGVEACEARIALDGDDSGVATGPLPEVAGNPIGGVLEDGPAVAQVPRYDQLNADLVLSTPVPDPTVFPDYPSKTMLMALAPQPTFTPDTYSPDDSLMPYFPNGTDAFAPDPSWDQE